jgi:hypothetical protein
VRVVGSAILFALLLAGYGYLCRRLKAGKWFLWSAPVLMLPVSALQFGFAVYGRHYTFYLFTGFFVLGMLLHWREARGRGARAALLTGAGALSLLSGLNGPRYLMVFYVPLCLAALWEAFAHRKEAFVGEGAKRWKNEWVAFAAAAVFAGACAVAGYLINREVLALCYTFHQYDDISFRAFDVQTVALLINAGWKRSASCRGDALVSIHALQNLIALLLIGLTVAGIRDILRNGGRYTAGERLFGRVVLSALLVVCATYLLTDAPYADRYNIPVTVFALPLVVVYLNRARWEPKWKTLCVGLIIGAVAGNSARVYHLLYQTDDTAEVREIATRLEEGDYREGYASFWTANVLTERSDGTADVRCWGNDNTTSEEFSDMADIETVNPWLQTKAHEGTVPQGKVFLLLNHREYEAFSIVSRLEGQTVLYDSFEYRVYAFDSYDALRACVDGGA